MNLPVKTGIKPKDFVIMRHRVSGVSAERKPIAFSAHQPLGWKGGLDISRHRMGSLKRVTWTN